MASGRSRNWYCNRSTFSPSYGHFIFFCSIVLVNKATSTAVRTIFSFRVCPIAFTLHCFILWMSIHTSKLFLTVCKLTLWTVSTLARALETQRFASYTVHTLYTSKIVDVSKNKSYINAKIQACLPSRWIHFYSNDVEKRN